MLRLYFECPSHGMFSIKVGLSGDRWPKDHQCPHCGALSKRDYKLTSVSEDQ